MREAIEKYYRRVGRRHYIMEDYSDVSRDIREQFQHGTIPIERKDRTDVSAFQETYGYDLPEEIDSYINLFWHSYISSYVDTYEYECIILFQVLKKEGDSSDDVLFYKHGLMDLAKDWVDAGGDIRRYIPIGWLGYSGGNVVYEVKTRNIYVEDFDEEGVVEEKPIAGSLKELINKMTNHRFEYGY